MTIPTDGGFPKMRYLRDKRGYVQRSHGGHHHKRYTATFQNPKHRCLVEKEHPCMLRNRVASENGVIGLFVFLHIQQYAILVVLFVFLIRQAVLETTHTSLSLHFLFEPEKSPYAPSRRKSSAWRASSSLTVWSMMGRPKPLRSTERISPWCDFLSWCMSVTSSS